MIFYIMISHKNYIAIGDFRVISDSVKFHPCQHYLGSLKMCGILMGYPGNMCALQGNLWIM